MRALTGLVLGLGLAATASPRALADDVDAPSRFHGNVSTRGNYYWERSTRVMAPSIHGSLVTPSGARIDATYLLDAITSASQATGVQSDVGFTELRNDVSLGLGYEVDVGTAQLDLAVSARTSKEPDYLSRGAGFSGALALNERTSTLRLNGYLLHDAVSKIDRMAPATNLNRLTATDPVRVGSLDAFSLGFALDQVLTPTLVATLGYDTSLLRGFQANVYRTAAFANMGGRPEEHPEQRVREAGYLWIAHYVTAARSALRVGYRFYRDTWDIVAHAPEARLHQELGRHAELRLRYRYYRQNSAYFWRKGGNLREDRYATADPKMSPFRDQTLGIRLRLALTFLSFTPLDFAHEAVLDFGVEYIFNTNRYGNGLMAQSGLSWPF